MTLVVEPSEPVVNGKVQNLVNALHAARHDTLVISDSDVRLTPGYLRVMVGPLADPQMGYVCSLVPFRRRRRTGSRSWSC